MAALTPRAFDLTGPSPVVRLAASATKNNKPACQPLAPTVAADLALYLAGKPADEPVWPRTWATQSADMLALDMAARVPIEVTSPDGAEVRDFHALRNGLGDCPTPPRAHQGAHQLARTRERTRGRSGKR